MILRLYLGMNKNINNLEDLPLTTNSSFKISKLQNNLNKLDLLNYKNKRGKYPLPEKEFLELMLIPFNKKKTENSKVSDYKNTYFDKIEHTKLPLFLTNTNLSKKKNNTKIKIEKIKEKEKIEKNKEKENNKLIKKFVELGNSVRRSILFKYS